ncbi:MAG: hypothetical protein ACE5FT_03735 [Candidatus Nanoarchaeia archaeon]
MKIQKERALWGLQDFYVKNILARIMQNRIYSGLQNLNVVIFFGTLMKFIFSQKVKQKPRSGLQNTYVRDSLMYSMIFGKRLVCTSFAWFVATRLLQSLNAQLTFGGVA